MEATAANVRSICETEFSRALLAARVAAKITQTALAARLGVRQSTISQWEQGVFVPVKDNVAALRGVLGELPEPPESKDSMKPPGNPNGAPGKRSDAVREHMRRAWARRAESARPMVPRASKQKRVTTPARRERDGKTARVRDLLRENATLRRKLADLCACLDLARDVAAD